MRIVSRFNPVAVLLLPLSALLTASALLAGGPVELLGTLPAILLAAALAFDRYPGEDLIERIARRLRPRRAAVAATVIRRAPEAAALRLLASLSGCRSLRGPPLSSAHA